MTKDIFSKEWIKEMSIEILQEYQNKITVRQLYYRLVTRGMTNDINHYKRTVSSLTDARWDNIISFASFIDRERAMFGETASSVINMNNEIEKAKKQLTAWITNYSLNKWQNQKKYIEIWIEKKALQGVFENPCIDYQIGLAPCKGYASLTFIYEAMQRFNTNIENDKEITILYFGDYDPSGMDIPRSIKNSLIKMGCYVNLDVIALTPMLIRKLKLPSVPAKKTDTRTKKWGLKEVVELDAVEPNMLSQLCTEAIEKHFDKGLYQSLKQKEKKERLEYQQQLKKYVRSKKFQRGCEK